MYCEDVDRWLTIAQKDIKDPDNQRLANEPTPERPATPIAPPNPPTAPTGTTDDE